MYTDTRHGKKYHRVTLHQESPHPKGPPRKYSTASQKAEAKRLQDNLRYAKTTETKKGLPEEEEKKPEKVVQVEAETLKKTKRAQLVLPEERQTVKTARVQKPVPARFKTAKFLKSPPA